MLFCFERRKYGVSMFRGFEAGEDPGDLPFRADHERGPLDPHIFPAVHALLLEHIKFLDDRFVFIGQQRIGQIVFFFEFLLFRRLIGGDAEYNGSSLLDFLVCVAEPARF